jgi:hypothetical protein
MFSWSSNVILIAAFIISFHKPITVSILVVPILIRTMSSKLLAVDTLASLLASILFLYALDIKNYVSKAIVFIPIPISTTLDELYENVTIWLTLLRPFKSA